MKQSTLDLHPPIPGDPPPFYNTQRLVGEAKARAQQRASGQELAVLRAYEDIWPAGATPSTIHERMQTAAPLTSIRRAVSNLTKRGLLRKTRRQRIGPFGALEHVWEAKR